MVWWLTVQLVAVWGTDRHWNGSETRGVSQTTTEPNHTLLRSVNVELNWIHLLPQIPRDQLKESFLSFLFTYKARTRSIHMLTLEITHLHSPFQSQINTLSYIPETTQIHSPIPEHTYLHSTIPEPTYPHSQGTGPAAADLAQEGWQVHMAQHGPWTRGTETRCWGGWRESGSVAGE